MVLRLLLTNVTKITHAEIPYSKIFLYLCERVINVRMFNMPISELKMNPIITSTVDDKIVEKTDFVDKSEMLFSYMNMIAFNNKLDLKLN